MAFRGIQGKGIKGRSGRKSKLEEVKNALAMHKEKVTQEALVELANNKVFEMLQQCKTIRDVQALGLPITLKGMKEVKDVNVITPKPILYAVQSSDLDQEDNVDEKENKMLPRRNVSKQNNLNSSILDTLGSE